PGRRHREQCSTAAGSSSSATTSTNHRNAASLSAPSSVAKHRTGPRSPRPPPITIDGDFLDLQLGERLGLGGSLGNQLGHGLALLVGELHCRSAAALADCRVYCGVDMGDP